jgi:hypothetical protein
LKSEQIDGAAKFLGEFHKTFPILIAFWLKDSAEGEWHLYVASDHITDDDLGAAYGEVVRITGQLQDPCFNPFQVKIVGTDDPVATVALDLQRRYPAKIATRLHGKTLDGVSVAEMYIYPSPYSVPVI